MDTLIIGGILFTLFGVLFSWGALTWQKHADAAALPVAERRAPLPCEAGYREKPPDPEPVRFDASRKRPSHVRVLPGGVSVALTIRCEGADIDDIVRIDAKREGTDVVLRAYLLHPPAGRVADWRARAAKTLAPILDDLVAELTARTT